jgi:hypothetical protein
MPRRGRVLQTSILVSMTLVVGCVTVDTAGDGTTASSATGDTVTTNSEGQPEVTTPADCEPATDGIAWRDDATMGLEQISTEDGLEVYAAEYPLPGPTEGLWSQWGQGIALGDGRHLSAVGDHLGVDANSYFFVYDSGGRTLTRFGDVLSVVPHEDGAFGYGKVHAAMVMDACGSIWAATYWGTRDDLTYENGYEGDRLLEIDTHAGTISDRGAFAGEFGSPTMTMAPDGTTLVAGSVDVESGDTDRGVLTVYDTSARETVTQVDDPRQEGFRALGIDPVSDNVFYAIGDNSLATLDPRSGELTDLDVTLPGWWLRSVTRPAPDGTVYGAADDEPGLFSISPAGELTDLGDPGGSTTSIAMTPDGSRIFWMPEAHGGAWEVGAVVNSMDTATGEIAEVTSLLDPFEDELGLLPGGTYSIVYDDGKLILGINASALGDDSGFGTVVLVVIEGV